MQNLTGPGQFPTLHASWRRAGPACALLRFLRDRASELAWALLRQVMPRRGRFGPAKGTFSAHELVGQNRIVGRIVQPAQPGPRVSPGCLRIVAGMQQDTIAPWPVFWSLHPEARLAGATLGLQDTRKRVCFEAVYGPYSHQTDPAYRYWRLLPETRLAGNWTSIVSRWSAGFYHWFMDALPRLGLLGEFPPDTGIIVPHRLESYAVDTLKWLGLADRVRPTSERHLVIENYYFSSPPAMTGCHNPYAVVFLRRSFLHREDASFQGPRRFYLKRVDKSRGVVNEEQVLDFFKCRGWGVVDTETMSLARQIRLFSQAEAICALHGAGLTNLLWCPPGCRVVELVAQNYRNGCYESLADLLQLDYDFMICAADAASRALVDLDRLRQLIDR